MQAAAGSSRSPGSRRAARSGAGEFGSSHLSHDSGLIAAGEQMHCLAACWTEFMRRRRRTMHQRPVLLLRFYLAYPVIILVVMSLIFVFVMPKFQPIFRDFKHELTPPTRQIIIFFETSTFLQVLIAIAGCCWESALSSLFPLFRNITPFGRVCGPVDLVDAGLRPICFRSRHGRPATSFPRASTAGIRWTTLCVRPPPHSPIPFCGIAPLRDAGGE